MKYICLGYMDENINGNKSQSEVEKFVDQCFAYDEKLIENGNNIGGEALQPVSTATTVRMRSNKISITDGPFAETKEQLGGIMILEAHDLNHAIQLMSNHPSTRMGTSWEIRPAADLSGMIGDSKKRRNIV